MSENLLAYWRSHLYSEEEIPITTDGFIFKYSIFNEYSNEGLSDWICCQNRKKLFSFIKYVILPSLQLSRSVGIMEGTIVFGVYNFDDTLFILDASKADESGKFAQIYEEHFRRIEEIEHKEFNFNELKEYINNLCVEVDIKEGIFNELDVFENISSVGKELIAAYEESGNIDILESLMELNKSDIEELFENIEDNRFMLKKIFTILNERNIS